VDEFLLAHAGIVTFYDLFDPDDIQAAMRREVERVKSDDELQGHKKEETEMERTCSRASFFMTAGMASAMGGNEMGAWHWYWLARDVYMKYIREHDGDEHGGTVKMRLGVLYGVLGDLNKDLGYDQDTVLGCYERGIGYLSNLDREPSRLDARSLEDFLRAQGALLNKAGEVYHTRGDINRALEYYIRALNVRKMRYEAAVSDDSTPHDILVPVMVELATSYAKVADAQALVGDIHESKKTQKTGAEILDRAGTMIHTVRLESTHRMYELLRAHFDST